MDICRPHHRQIEPGGIGQALDDRRFAAVERLDQRRKKLRAAVAALGEDIDDHVGPRAVAREQQAKRERPLPVGVGGTTGEVADMLAGARVVIAQEQRLDRAARQRLSGLFERHLVRQTACLVDRAELHHPRHPGCQEIGSVRYPLRRPGAGGKKPDGEIPGRGGTRSCRQARKQALDQGALRSLPQRDAEPSVLGIDQPDRCRVDGAEHGRRYRIGVRRCRAQGGGAGGVRLARHRLVGGCLGSARGNQAHRRARRFGRAGLGKPDPSAIRGRPLCRRGRCRCDRQARGHDRRGGGETRGRSIGAAGHRG